jgi:hypothetical protein
MSNLKDVHRLLDALEIEIERLTGRSFDLETSDRVAVAEFKFIRWQGGPESIRQNQLFKLYLLARSSVEAISLRRTSELSLLLLRKNHVPVSPISFRNGFLAFAPTIAGG